LANQERLVESAGPSGRGRYYRLTSAAYQQLGQALAYHVDRRLTRENVKARLLATLETRDLTNSQVREITQLGREAVKRLMASLRQEGRLQVVGAGRARRWRLLPQLKP
jgi:hypothetical protein